jgi:hypothetical protein
MNRPPGVKFHTCRVIGCCERTGVLGIAAAAPSLAVGACVPPLDDWLEKNTSPISVASGVQHGRE